MPSSTPSRSPPAAAASAPRRSPSRRGSERLRLRIAEARVELEHLRPRLRQHQPSEEHADERRPAAGELLDHGPVDLLDELRHLRLSEPGDGREGAHPAGVRPGVPVADPLEVLRRGERHDALSVAEGEDGDLLAGEQLLDHDRALERRRRAQALVELLGGLADEDALAGGEAVHLDDAGRPRDRERLGRRDAGRGHHVLGEALRPLDPRRRPARAEDADAVAAERVADAGDERRLGPDHGQVGVEAAGEPEQGLRVVRPHRVAVAERRDSRIARRGVERGQAGCLRQLPRQRVLATARPDEEHLHGGRVYSPSRLPITPALRILAQRRQ